MRASKTTAFTGLSGQSLARARPSPSVSSARIHPSDSSERSSSRRPASAAPRSSTTRRPMPGEGASRASQVAACPCARSRTAVATPSPSSAQIRRTPGVIPLRR